VRAALTLALAVFPLAAGAQAPNCANPVTQADMNQCSYAAWLAADAELNRLWGIAKPRADAGGYGRALLDAQRAWIAYRDAACAAEAAPYAGGSIQPLIVNSCFERLTLRRNEDLRTGP